MQPVAALAGLSPYTVPAPAAPLDLDLRGNEGARPDAALLEVLAGRADLLRAYPDARALEARLAERLALSPEQVLVTAGADDALDRACRALLAPDRVAVIPVPAFEMTLRYARLAGATIRAVPWGADFPLSAVLEAIDPAVSLVVLTSPNNPTGGVLSAADVARVARAAPHALVLLDLAYVEYADHDPTLEALALPNVVVLRTFSKARGLAGLRVGFALGPPEVLRWLRAAGAPYPVSALSLALALAALDHDPDAHVAQARAERQAIAAQLAALGAQVPASQANFVFARCGAVGWLVDGLAGLGIGVRPFPGRPGLEDAVRIGCPGDDGALRRLLAGLRAVLRPEALLLDLDALLPDAPTDAGPLQESLARLAARCPLALLTARSPGAVGESLGDTLAASCVPTEGMAEAEQVQAALRARGVADAWLVSPAPALLRAARAAGVVPLALSVASPSAPVARTLPDLSALEALLP